MTIEETAKLTNIITTRIKAVQKELVDELLRVLPPEVEDKNAADYIVSLLSIATFGLGTKMCLDCGMTKLDMVDGVHRIVAEINAQSNRN